MNVRRKNKKDGIKSTRTDSAYIIKINQLKLSFAALYNRPLANFLTLVVITVSLILPASLYLVAKNIAHVAQNMEHSVHINGYLTPAISNARAYLLKDKLETLNDVKQITYVSAKQGLEDLSQYTGFEQALSMLNQDILPAVLVITPNSSNNADIKTLVTKLYQYQEFMDIKLDEDWFNRFDAIKNFASVVAIILTILMFSALFIIIGNTLRFNVLEKKDEIQTMKLIGATDSFILQPYRYLGIWFGLIGAIFAWVVTSITTILIDIAANDIAALYDSQFHIIGLNIEESLMLIMLGSYLGAITAHLSVKRYLQEIAPV